VYKHVYSVPFDDPEGKYEALRSITETTAASLGIELCRLAEEVKSPSGKARTAKSPKTRRLYRSLVRRAFEEERFAAAQVFPVPAQKQPLVSRSILGGVTLSTDEEFEASEILVETAENPSPCSPLSERLYCDRTGRQNLAFRVWDADKCHWTAFDECDGFVSGKMTLHQARPFPEPFCRSNLEELAISHLSKTGGECYFRFTFSA
jgi:hypothetical protein